MVLPVRPPEHLNKGSMMPNIKKAQRRESHRRKAKYGMRIHGKSIESILRALQKRANKRG